MLNYRQDEEEGSDLTDIPFDVKCLAADAIKLGQARKVRDFDLLVAVAATLPDLSESSLDSVLKGYVKTIVAGSDGNITSHLYSFEQSLAIYIYIYILST
jgi:hypothetical protein